MITLHTPQGMIEVDPATVTDAELAELGLTRQWADEQLQAEADDARLKEIAAMAHSAMKVPLLAEGFVLLCKKLGYS